MVVDNLARIKHMLDAASLIVSFIQKTDLKDLKNNVLLLSALLRQLEIFGEAASRISLDFREKHSNIPWHQIIGMRNRLIHAYFDVNIDIVWKAVMIDIPKIIPNLERIIDIGS